MFGIKYREKVYFAEFTIPNGINIPSAIINLERAGLRRVLYITRRRLKLFAGFDTVSLTRKS